MLDSVFLVAVLLLGACVGSFLNVVIWRLPRGTFFSLGNRSVCPACGARIALRDNLPVLGWLLLLGRARCCKARISPRYPLVELLTAAAFTALWLWPPSGLSFDAHRPDGLSLLAFALHGYFVASLIANTFIDIDHRILPDELTYSSLLVGLLGAFLVPGLAGSFTAPGLNPALGSLLYSAVGAAAGALLTQGIAVVAKRIFRKEAMGFGDVKLMAAIGAFVGPVDVLLVFFLACLAGAAFGLVQKWRTGDSYIAFGPYLVVGALTMLFAGKQVHTLLFETWPEWQSNQRSPLLLAVAGLFCVVLLFVLIRKGRRL